MHISLASWLALTATLLPPTTAFYPYHYGDTDNKESPSKSSRTLPPSSNRSITLSIRRLPSSIRRQNAYNIVISPDPKEAKSVAIDQDGGDLSYMIGVSMGDNKKEYHLLLDSAASNTWIMGKDCVSEACGRHNSFGKGDSSSLQTQSTPFSITYGTGSVSGTLASDTVHLGSLSPSLTFGLASNVSQEFSSYPMDGILGIGRGAKNVPGGIAAPQLMDVLSTDKSIDARIYGIHLSRAKDNSADGELNLGSINKDRFSGDLVWTNIIENENGFWEIPLSSAAVDNNAVSLSSSRSILLDTGTSFILMPSSDALAFHQKIPGYKQNGETFSVPCDTDAILQFSFGKTAFNISTPDWRGGKLSSGLCRSNIIGRQTFAGTQWLVGDVFLKNVYSVYDFDSKRVGFGTKSAQAQGSSSSAPSASSAAPSSSPTSTGRVSAGAGGLIGVPGSTASRSGAKASETVAPQKGQSGAVSMPNMSVGCVLLGFGALLFFV